MDSEREQLVETREPTEPKPSGNGRYDFEIDLQSRSTHATVLRLVGDGRRVLELGPATGYMTRELSGRSCAVVGIEIDAKMAAEVAQFCERMIVGDLDTLDLESELGEDRFDVIIAADVLEHLKDPLGALRRLTPFLSDDGYFVISLPNVAHGSVRLALLAGNFNYQHHGLLDGTHLRFFTRESVEQLLDDAELGMAELHRQELAFDASEVPFDRSRVPAELLDQLTRDPDAQTYQFVIKAIPFDRPGLRELQRRLRALAEENSRLRGLEPQVHELQQALAAISGKEGQLRASLIDAHEQLLQRDEQLNRMREEVIPLQQLLGRLQASPLGRAYIQLRRLRRVAGAVGRRIERIRDALQRF
jgi:2-polyprenyl-3-methyl-5-hydroxy-6-metoxy-1,4-benzoquinol methylase